ncbi:MAG: hypothetical protein R3C68_16840 [Myxococcota bacterium]
MKLPGANEARPYVEDKATVAVRTTIDRAIKHGKLKGVSSAEVDAAIKGSRKSRFFPLERQPQHWSGAQVVTDDQMHTTVYFSSQQFFPEYSFYGSTQYSLTPGEKYWSKVVE